MNCFCCLPSASMTVNTVTGLRHLSTLSSILNSPPFKDDHYSQKHQSKYHISHPIEWSPVRSPHRLLPDLPKSSQHSSEGTVSGPLWGEPNALGSQTEPKQEITKTMFSYVFFRCNESTAEEKGRNNCIPKDQVTQISSDALSVHCQLVNLPYITGSDLIWISFVFRSSWQVQYFVGLEVQISWQVLYFAVVEVQISWQAQYFVNLEVQIERERERKR